MLKRGSSKEKATAVEEPRENASSETGMVVRENPGALARPPEPLLGFENFDDSDLVIPRLSIVQPSSKEGTPGTFRSNLTGEEKEQLRITPMTYSKGMVHWSEELGNDPECRSNDALTPDPTIENPKHDRCHERIGNRLRPVCPYAVWRDKEPPTCKMTYNLIAIEMESMRPFLVSLHGTSVRSAKKLISYVWQSRRNFFDVGCRMSLSKVNNTRGTFFVVEFNDYEDHEPGTFRELFESLRSYDVNRTFEAEQEAAKDNEAPPSDKF